MHTQFVCVYAALNFKYWYALHTLVLLLAVGVARFWDHRVYDLMRRLCISEARKLDLVYIGVDAG